ncbi:MAG: protein kinase [Verrucomicrobiota bacterium]
MSKSQVRHFGDYELIEELARGGMGIVYRARQVSLQRPVAVKMILAGQLATAESVARFQFEAQAAAVLDHPNIVPIYEVGELDGSNFFSMRLIVGQTLGKALAGKPLPFDRAARLMATVARAIQHAHERGVLHRDLKPGNIMLDAAGEPHITDFGLAKIAETERGLTRSQMALGTPAYMPPEQAAGRVKEITTAADIYGLGAVLFETLTGQPPFAGETPMAIARRVIEDEAPSPAALNPAVPLDLATIALKCLEKEPHRRYASATALADDLERWLRHEPIEAHSASSWERVRKWVKRKPLHAALAGTVLLAFASLLIGMLWHNRRIRAAQQATEAANRELALHLREIEWQQAENAVRAGRTPDALAVFARFLRETPADVAVASRLSSLLETRAFPVPALPPLQHGVPVNLARMSPNGQHLLTVADDGVLRSWNLKAGTLEWKEELNLAGVHLQWFPDQRRVLALTKDGRAIIWDTARHALEREFGAVIVDGRKMMLSADGRFLALVGSDKDLRLCDTASGELLARTNAPNAEIPQLEELGPEGQAVFYGHHHGMWLWRGLKGELIPLIGTNEGPVTVACDWPRRRAYVTVENMHGPTQGMLILDLATGRELRRNSDATPWHIIVPVPGEPRLIVARWGMGIAVLDAETLEQRVAAFGSSPVMANLSTDQKYRVAYTAAHDGTGRLYDLSTGQPLLEPIQHEGAIVSHELSPDGALLVTASQDGTARLWNLRMRVAESIHFRPDEWVFGFDLTADGERLAVAYGHYSRIYDVNSGKALTEPVVAHDATFKVRLSPDQRLVAAPSYDYSVRIWDAKTGALVGPGARHAGRVWIATFSGDSRLVASASEDRTAFVFEAATGRLLFPPLRHENDVLDVSFSPDDRLLATASVDATARLWQVATGAPAGHPFRHQGTVWTARFSPDGRYLLTASNDRTAQVWDVKSGERAAPPIRSDEGVLSAVFDRAGSRILISTLSNARIFDAKTSRPLTPAMPHGNRVWFARFSPDERWVATASEDRTARVWDATTGFPVTEPLSHRTIVSCLAWLPDSPRLLTGSYDGTVRLWRLPEFKSVPAWLPELAEALAGKQDDGHGGRVAVSNARLETLRRLAETSHGDVPSDRWLRWFLIERLQAGPR